MIFENGMRTKVDLVELQRTHCLSVKGERHRAP